MYVDGFVMAVPQSRLAEYKKMARASAKIWKEFGALDYVECIADDVPYGKTTSFPRAVKLKDDEVVVFAWITYTSRAQRDRINKKIMDDPRMKAMFPNIKDVPFDAKRMIFGGFKQMVRG